MKEIKEMLTQRLPVFLPEENAENIKFIDEFINAVKKNPDSCHEVWLSTSLGYPTIERHREIAEYYLTISEKFKSAGIRVSIQINNTMGHGYTIKLRDCSGLVYPGSDIETLYSEDGTTSPYSFCWRGEKFIKYNVEAAKAYAKVKPFRVWFDDDLRARNHEPITYGCFCPSCIEKFNDKYSHKYTREELVKEINRGNIETRKEWIEFLREGLYNFTYTITKAMSEVSPETSFALQTGANHKYSGYGFDFLLGAMRDASKKSVGIRPGGGAYDDNEPSVFLKKARTLEYISSTVPDYVDDIRPEIDNIPDVAYGKSVNGVAFESDLYFAHGAYSMSYAMMNRTHEPMSYHEKEFAAFSKHYPYFKRLSDINKRTKSSGVELFSSKESYLRPLREKERDFGYEMEYLDIGFSPVLGIPQTFKTGDKHPVYALAAPNARGLTDKDIEMLLGSSVIADGASVKMLIDRGYDVFGIDVFPVQSILLDEVFVSGHEANRGICAPRWGKLINYEDGYAFIPKKDGAEPIAVYDGANKFVSPLFDNKKYPFGISAVTLTTSRGGKWAVYGHKLWSYLQSFARRNQILNAIDFISDKKTLKARLDCPLKADILPRITDKNKIAAVSIVNATVGESGEMPIIIRDPEKLRFSFASGDKNTEELRFEKTKNENEYRVFMPSIPGWSVGTVFCE